MSAIAPLLTAIKARADGDTGAGGLFAASPLLTGWYSLLAPQEGSTLPYVVVFPVSHRRDNVFSTTAGWSDDIALQFSAYTDGAGDLTTDQTIVDRIITRFDRWAPTVSGYTASQLIHDGSQIVQDDNNIRHHVFEFRCVLSK